MNPAPTQAPLATTLAPALAGRLGVIIAALCAVIARRFLREPTLVALIVPLWTRLSRAAQRFHRVMADVAAGRQPTPRQPREHRSGQASARPTTPLPSGHAWLVRALGYEAAAYMSQLNYLLAEPGVADLLAASPAAARILRPIAHMLGCQPIPALTLPRRPAKPRPASPPKPTPPAIPKHRPHHPRHNPHPLSFRTPARAAPDPDPLYYSWLPWPPAKPV